ncbi:MAG: helix-turn-helix transcriptional regulator [Jatrophihabitantaceae bacterium]
MQDAVERVINTMWDQYHEPLSLEDMAGTAVFSRFYFSRIFRSVTGTSPGRFLTAVRLYKAKHLLLQTSASVTDISYQVGYNSPGTFSSRFTRSVGMSPARFRYLSRTGMAGPASPPDTSGLPCSIGGWVSTPSTDRPLRIYLGAFDSTIAQGQPASCTRLEGAGPYQLAGLPDGEWYVHAVAVAVRDLDPRPWARRPLYLAAGQLVEVSGGRPVRCDLQLRPPQLTDLPILLALPELDSTRLAEPISAQDCVG